MLTLEENERLTRVGPGTPAGELLRRYWQALCPVAELTDEKPIKPLRLLGEDLLVFRDGRGRYGLVEARCKHRRVSLTRGFVEDDGIRCAYHGWKYATDGRCIEQPFEPADSRLKDGVRLRAYPVQALGGLLFGYLGPGPAPLLPRWDVLAREDGRRFIQILPLHNCNWLQCEENTADTVHTYYLHGHVASTQGLHDSGCGLLRAAHRALRVVGVRVGCGKGAGLRRRAAGNGSSPAADLSEHPARAAGAGGGDPLSGAHRRHAHAHPVGRFSGGRAGAYPGRCRVAVRVPGGRAQRRRRARPAVASTARTSGRGRARAQSTTAATRRWAPPTAASCCFARCWPSRSTRVEHGLAPDVAVVTDPGRNRCITFPSATRPLGRHRSDELRARRNGHGERAVSRLRLGIAGAGIAALQVLPHLRELEGEIELTALADIRRDNMDYFAHSLGRSLACYDGVEEMCALGPVDAVWVASPNRLHAEHVIAAARHGKHVICEKPMAVTLEQCQAMVEAVETAGVKYVQGHSKVYDAPVRAMGQLIRSGELGRVIHLHTWNFNDWLIRALMPEEVRTDLGAGPVFRQGPHQVDTIRYLGGGRVRSVRAQAGRHEPHFPDCEGNYTAFLEFEDGTPATLVFDGYGYFDSVELTWGVGEAGKPAKNPDSRIPKARPAGPGQRAGEIRAGARRQSLRLRRRRRLGHGRPAAAAVLRSDRGVLRARRDPPVAGRAVRVRRWRPTRAALSGAARPRGRTA